MPQNKSNSKKAAMAKKLSEEFLKIVNRLKLIAGLIEKLLNSRNSNDIVTEESFYKGVIESLHAFSQHPDYTKHILNHITQISVLIITYQNELSDDNNRNFYCLLMLIRNNERWLAAIPEKNRSSFNLFTDPTAIYFQLARSYLEAGLLYAKVQGQYTIGKEYLEKAIFYKNLYCKIEKQQKEKDAVEFKFADYHYLYAKAFSKVEPAFSFSLLEQARAILNQLGRTASYLESSISDLRAHIRTIADELTEIKIKAELAKRTEKTEQQKSQGQTDKLKQQQESQNQLEKQKYHEDYRHTYPKENPMPRKHSTDKKVSADVAQKEKEFSTIVDRFRVIEALIKKLLESRRPTDTATEASYYKDIIEQFLAFSKHSQYAEQITRHVAVVTEIIQAYQQTKPQDLEHALYCNLMLTRNSDRWLTAININDRKTTNESTNPFAIYCIQQRCYIELSAYYAEKKQFKISKAFYEKSNFYKNLYYKVEEDLKQKIEMELISAHYISILAIEVSNFEIEFSIALTQQTFKALTKLSHKVDKDSQAPLANKLKQIKELSENLQKQKVQMIKNKKIDEEFLQLEQHVSELLNNRKSDLETEEKVFDEFFKKHEVELETKDFINKLIRHIQKMSTIKITFIQSRNTSIQKTELIYLNNMLVRSQTRLLNILKKSKIYKDTPSSKKVQIATLLSLFISQMENCSTYEDLQQHDIAQQYYKAAIEHKVELDRIPTLSTAERRSVLYQYAQTHYMYAKASYNTDLYRAETYLNISNDCLQELIKQPLIESPLTTKIILALQNRIQSLQSTFQQKKLEIETLKLQEQARLAQVELKQIEEKRKFEEQQHFDEQQRQLEAQKKAIEEKQLKDKKYALENQTDALGNVVGFTTALTLYNHPKLPSNQLQPLTLVAQQNPPLLLTKMNTIQTIGFVSTFSQLHFDNLSSDFQQAVRSQKPIEITAAGMKLLEYCEFHTIMIQPHCSIGHILQGIMLFEQSYYHLQGIIDMINSGWLQSINIPIFLQRLNKTSVSLYQKRDNAIEILTQRSQDLTKKVQLSTTEIELNDTLSGAISSLNTITDRHVRKPPLLR